MWVRVCGQESIFDLFMMEVLPVSDETVNLSHKLCLVGIKHPELKKKQRVYFRHAAISEPGDVRGSCVPH